jgi:hypothetical protein
MPSACSNGRLLIQRSRNGARPLSLGSSLMKRCPRLGVALFACVVAFPVNGSADQARPRSAEATDACELLTSADISEVQGEPVTAAKSSRLPNPQFTMAQCFYALGSSSKGVSLAVAVSSAEQPGAPHAFWVDRFQRERERAKRARAAAGRAPADDAEPVSGIGDEAFWVGDAHVGSLYVRAGRRFFRLSVGGVSDPGERQERSLRLARAVLKRLHSP